MARKSRFWWTWLALASVAVTASGAQFLKSDLVRAATGGGRALNHTYYSDQFVDTTTVGYVFISGTGVTNYEGITSDWTTTPVTVDSFIEGVRVRLYDSSSLINRVRASAIVNIMLGYNGNDPAFNGPDPMRAVNGVTVAQSEFVRWSQYVRIYDAAWKQNLGWGVDFNTVFYNPDQPVPEIDGVEFHNGGAPDYQLDVASYQYQQPNPEEHAVIFHNPDGTTLNIMKKCMNIIGDVGPLSPSGFTYEPHMKLDTGTEPGPNLLVGRTPVTLTFRVWATNVGDAAGGAYELYTDLDRATPYVTPGGKNGPVDTGPSIDAGASTREKVVTYTVAGNTPDGTQFCLYSSVRPYTNVDPGFRLSRDNVPPDIFCYTVQNPRYPGIVAKNGDVHAGGGACTNSSAPVVNGNITVLSESHSYGEYVVSASGLIGNFGSNNSGAGTGDPDLLRLGQNGGYNQSCRPDFLGFAQDYAANHGSRPYLLYPGSLAAMTEAGAVYYFPGDLTINGGVVPKNVTLYVTGNLTITGDIALSNNPAARQDQPSFGVIAGGDISFTSSARTVAGYYFSNGTLDTCSNRDASCNNTLTVNGFLMATKMGFHRYGPAGTTGAQPAEIVALTAQLYLNPPPLFDDTTQTSSLRVQGEQPPLF